MPAAIHSAEPRRPILLADAQAQTTNVIEPTTVLTKQEPGGMLGGFLIAGTIAAVLAVRPRAVYLIIPVPALA